MPFCVGFLATNDKKVRKIFGWVKQMVNSVLHSSHALSASRSERYLKVSMICVEHARKISALFNGVIGVFQVV